MTNVFVISARGHVTGLLRYVFMWFARFQILICELQSIWRKLLVLSWLYSNWHGPILSWQAVAVCDITKTDRKNTKNSKLFKRQLKRKYIVLHCQDLIKARYLVLADRGLKHGLIAVLQQTKTCFFVHKFCNFESKINLILIYVETT